MPQLAQDIALFFKNTNILEYELENARVITKNQLIDQKNDIAVRYLFKMKLKELLTDPYFNEED